MFENNLETDFENLKEEVLANYLRRFYAEVRNKQGGLYSKTSLLSIRAAIYRHLTQPPQNVGFNILVDSAFIAANNVLVGQCRKLKAAGKDTSKHHPPIKQDDLKKMYESRVLSPDNPVSLQRKVFFEVVLHFGRRGREGLRTIQKDDIIFKVDEHGTEYATLGFNALEKNHQGLSAREREHSQQMYATGNEDCPLMSLKFYLSKLNENCSAFFQRPKTVNWEGQPSWYSNSPVGFNTLGNMMPVISEAAKLSLRYTNHCIRATTVTMLRNANIAPNDIIAVTGHRNVQSLTHYDQGPSSETRTVMSNTLSSARHESVLVPEGPGDVEDTSPASSECALVPQVTGISNPVIPYESASTVPMLLGNKSDRTEKLQTSSLTQSSVRSSTLDVTRALFSNVVFNNSTVTVHIHEN